MFLYIFLNDSRLTLYTGSTCVKSSAASHDIDEMSTNRTVLLGLKENQWETVGCYNTNLRGWWVPERFTCALESRGETRSISCFAREMVLLLQSMSFLLEASCFFTISSLILHEKSSPTKIPRVLDQKTAKHSTHGCGTHLPLQPRNSFQIVLLSATT
ncbi:hypothetical protein NC651_010680 [Populus alba x Populus x berolinensis]|nr:hypothetical protein NC651_010680 [Populus alba x Populus x berolinensis]